MELTPGTLVRLVSKPSARGVVTALKQENAGGKRFQVQFKNSRRFHRSSELEVVHSKSGGSLKRFGFKLPFAHRDCILILSAAFDNKQRSDHATQRAQERRKRIGTDFELERSARTVGAYVRRKGLLKRRHLMTIVNWKSPLYGEGHALPNTDEWIQSVSKAAFEVCDDRIRVATLTFLHGVRLPVASAILHFTFPERYTIWDWRVLAALDAPRPKSYENPTYANVTLWWNLCQFMEHVAGHYKLSIRTVDKALWQYSKTVLRQRKEPKSQG